MRTGRTKIALAWLACLLSLVVATAWTYSYFHFCNMHWACHGLERRGASPPYWIDSMSRFTDLDISGGGLMWCDCKAWGANGDIPMAMYRGKEPVPPARCKSSWGLRGSPQGYPRPELVFAPVTAADRRASWHFGLWGLSTGVSRFTFYGPHEPLPINLTEYAVVPLWMLFLPFALATYWAFTKLQTGRWFHPWEEAGQLAGWVARVGRGIVRHRRGLGISAVVGGIALAILFVIFHWPMFFGPPVGARLQAALANAAVAPGHGVVFNPVPSRQVWVPTSVAARGGEGLRLVAGGWSCVLPSGTRTIRLPCGFSYRSPRHWPGVYYRLKGRWRAATPAGSMTGGQAGAVAGAARAGLSLTLSYQDSPMGPELQFYLPAQTSEVQLIPAKGNPIIEFDITASGPAWRLSWGYRPWLPTPTWNVGGDATIKALRGAIRGYVAFPWLREEGPVMARVNRLYAMRKLDLNRAIFAADGRKLAQIRNLNKALDIALLCSCRRPRRVYWCHAARGGVFCLFRIKPGGRRWAVWWFDPKGNWFDQGSVRLLGRLGGAEGQIPPRLAKLAVPFFRQMPPVFSFFDGFGASLQEPWRVPPAVPSAKPSPAAKPAVGRHLEGGR